MSRRNHGGDERGVSTVIGAILIAGLLVTTLVTVRVSFVPVWEKESEAARIVGLEAQLAQLLANLERQVDNRSQSSLSHALTLGDPKSGIFQTRGSPDTVLLHPTGRTATTASNRFLIIQANGTNLAGLNPTWTGISGSTTLNDVLAISNLRLRMAEVSKDQEGLDVTLRVLDANNDLVGTMNVAITDPANGPDYIVLVTVTDSVGNVITTAPESHHGQDEYTPYYVDALNPIYLFDQVLASAQAPVTLTLEHDVGLDTEYNIAYTEAGAGGLPVLVGSSGILREPYSATYIGGYIEYRSNTKRFPAQTYYIENGALIVEQSQGAVFRIQPSFDVTRSNDITAISVALPTISGDSTTRSGTATAVVETVADRHANIVANAPRFTLTVNTAFPSLWRAFWNETLDSAGLSRTATPAQYETFGTQGSATINIYGVTADPASTAYDMSIVIKQARIATTIQV